VDRWDRMNSVKPPPQGVLGRSIQWLGGCEAAVLLAVLGIAAGVGTFAVVAGAVNAGETQGIDSRILLAMRQPAGLAPMGSPAFQQAARDITALGSLVVLGLITFIACAFLALDGKTHMAFFVCLSVTGGITASSLLKELFQRPRPDLVPYAVSVSGTSFPTGHSMMSAVTFLTLGALLASSQKRRRLKAYFLLLATLLTVMVGLSRIYLGVHWPTDVLAGWTAGAVWALLCWLAARWLQNRKALEPEGTAP
jgi:undecaprenyl-diphosphatase